MKRHILFYASHNFESLFLSCPILLPPSTLVSRSFESFIPASRSRSVRRRRVQPLFKFSFIRFTAKFAYSCRISFELGQSPWINPCGWRYCRRCIGDPYHRHYQSRESSRTKIIMIPIRKINNKNNRTASSIKNHMAPIMWSPLSVFL